jgi:ferritin-like metal-binding protein YciE
MTYDYTALVQQIQEATRMMDLAMAQIMEQKAAIARLEEENERLRARLVKAMAVIEHYESPDHE